jgi:hypothetical protein
MLSLTHEHLRSQIAYPVYGNDQDNANSADDDELLHVDVDLIE